MNVKVDLTGFQKQMSQAQHVLTDLPQFAQAAMRKHTPIRSGNARSNTIVQGTQVIADYPYSQRLEDNWSKQTQGRGIIDPTVKDVQDEVDRRLKDL